MGLHKCRRDGLERTQPGIVQQIKNMNSHSLVEVSFLSDHAKKIWEQVKVWHKDHKREDGEPYSNHLARVANASVLFVKVQRYALLRLSAEEETCITAMLHDTFEDGKASLEAISKILVPPLNEDQCSRIMYALQKLTRINRTPDIMSYLRQIKSNPIACAVKMADLQDNMRDLKPGNRKDKYELCWHYLNTDNAN